MLLLVHVMLSVCAVRCFLIVVLMYILCSSSSSSSAQAKVCLNLVLYRWDARWCSVSLFSCQAYNCIMCRKQIPQGHYKGGMEGLYPGISCLDICTSCQQHPRHSCLSIFRRPMQDGERLQRQLGVSAPNHHLSGFTKAANGLK